jgi:hypothetical protein
MTEETARNEVFALFRTAWNSRAGGVVGGSVPTVIWQGDEIAAPPTEKYAYATISVLHAAGGQSSLSNAVGSNLWTNTGVVITQCFAPIGSGKSLLVASGLARIAVDTFRSSSTPGGVWFTKSHLAEVGPSRGWYQVNAVANFSYDDVR